MNRIMISVLLALLVLIAPYEVPENYVLAQRDQQNQFIVGILRADGTLIPFAQYGNGGWSNPWPKPRSSAESIYAESTEVIPNSLEDLAEPWFKQYGKIPRTWYFWSSAGAPIVLKASKVLKVQAHSGANWALLTNLPGRTSEDALDNEIGIASDAKIKVDAMIEVKSNTSEDKNIASFVKDTIKELMEDAETAEVSRLRGQQPPPEFPMRQFALTKEERAKIERSITKLYRNKSPVNGEYLYYFEAQKIYSKAVADANRECEDISLYRGWISTPGNDSLGLVDNQLTFTDCSRTGPGPSTPLGIMTLKNRTFLFVKEHGWESASYMILELGHSGLHRVLLDGGRLDAVTL
ncbi:MAG TPA: hypothetical protein VJS64_18425 [Pyrinomonadaceae bacterium]|nr:hypothetical protein [Pyrinomonadaceae bacterium]